MCWFPLVVFGAHFSLLGTTLGFLLGPSGAPQAPKDGLWSCPTLRNLLPCLPIMDVSTLLWARSAKSSTSRSSRSVVTCPSQVDAQVRVLTQAEREEIIHKTPGTFSGAGMLCGFKGCPWHRFGPCPGPCFKFLKHVYNPGQSYCPCRAVECP